MEALKWTSWMSHSSIVTFNGTHSVDGLSAWHGQTTPKRKQKSRFAQEKDKLRWRGIEH